MMLRAKRVWRTLSVAMLFGLPACGSSDPETSKTDQNLEIYSWWTNPGETDALANLLGMYQSKYPGTNVINAAVTGIVNAHQELESRMTGGSPPDTFQALGGWDLMRWVIYNRQNAAESKMEPVDFLAKAGNWASVLPKPVLDCVSYDGKMYSVPIAVHRYNTLFFNKKVLADNGLNAPTTWAEFYQVSGTLKAKGIVPLAFGNKVGMPMTLVTWDAVLIAKAGAEFRDSYLAGHEDPNDPRIIDTLNEVAKLLDYTNDDRDLLTWDQAAQKLVDGSAAMTIMGDWAKGFFLSHGMRADVDIGSLPAPGNQGVFVYLVDSFGLPSGARDRQATVNFLNLIGSLEAQDAFNPIKGSIPPRTDANRSKFDVLAQRTLQDFQTNKLTLGRDVYIKSSEFHAELIETMKQFGTDRKADTVLNMLKNRYDQL